MDERIIQFKLEETNETVDFEVYDQIEYGGHKYLLVIEAGLEDDEEAEGVILRQIGEEDDDLIYDLIDDEQEYMMVLELFRENADEYDLDYLKED
ncbi:DUF1292 domain-containing protein [Vallitalea okinawensis]|uniref:DUF1292 domain-containing protein n=1 Tax=Vallitalea okinawensis TaxID=2078660 RepID=UPI000CFC597B|nr:DUF1292 domain-containing protein [Vallitalea okinawensis]